MWLDPIFDAFPNLAIHEAVYEELILPSVKAYAEAMLGSNPTRLILHKDCTLTETEKMLRDSIENRIYPLTQYDPLLDNRDDKGEVKSLAYIAVKGLLYFAAHDSNILSSDHVLFRSEAGLRCLSGTKDDRNGRRTES